MPERMSDVLPAQAPLAHVSPASAAPVSRHVVFARCLSCTKHLGDDHWPRWLTASHQLTPHLQRFGSDCALLDLGPCADNEAVAVVQSLITRLANQASQRITLRAAIAPSGTLAQLALIHLLQTSKTSDAPAHQPLALVTGAEIPDLLRRLPITVLTRLRFADPTSFPPKTLAQAISRLEDYGARTLTHLAHLARLDANDLRRQFGARLGSLLAAIARGEDPLPFQPTPAPLHLRFRLRLTSPVTADRLLLGLLPFAREVASRLARRGLHAHTLELRLRWETGTQESATSATITRTLPRPIAGGRALAETLERMLATLVQTNTHMPQAVSASPASPASPAIEDVRLIVSHLTPRYPAQHAFWPQRARRLAATRELADLLARRHGKPLLFQSLLTAPDAIFDQNRSRLEPLAAGLADVADVAEGWGHPARPAADVADIATDVADTGADSTPIPHSIHWW